MKILNKKIRFVDFVPPIFLPALKKIKSHINLSRIEKSYPPVTSCASPILDSPVTPYVSPILCSYSQFNEDLIIDLLFMGKTKGFYIDIGANDPDSSNNTKRFYEKGWSGINIEPGKDSFEKLCLKRSRDINLNIGLGSDKGSLTFYKINENSQLSTFDKNLAVATAAEHQMTIEKVQIDVWRLVDVFERHGKDTQVDFMSLDAEGLDLEVLQSNDWDRFRPTLVIIEIDKGYRDIVGFMAQCNYLLIWNNEHNGIFVDKTTSDNFVKRMVCIDK
jgi:FkbM family methyltransferase